MMQHLMHTLLNDNCWHEIVQLCQHTSKQQMFWGHCLACYICCVPLAQ
jgi:hypothetical protein